MKRLFQAVFLYLFIPVISTATVWIPVPAFLDLDISKLTSPRGQDFDGLLNVKYSSAPDSDGELEQGETITVTTCGPHICKLAVLFAEGTITQDNISKTIYFTNIPNWNNRAFASYTVQGKTYSASVINDFAGEDVTSFTLRTTTWLRPVVGFYLEIYVPNQLNDDLPNYDFTQVTDVTAQTPLYFESQHKAPGIRYFAQIRDIDTDEPLSGDVEVDWQFTVAQVAPDLPSGTYNICTSAGVSPEFKSIPCPTKFIYTAPGPVELPIVTVDGADYQESQELSLADGSKTVTLTSPEGTTIHWRTDVEGAVAITAAKAPAEKTFTDSGTNSLTLTVSSPCALTYFAKHTVTGAVSEPKTLSFSGVSTAADTTLMPSSRSWHDLSGKAVSHPTKGTLLIERNAGGTHLRRF